MLLRLGDAEWRAGDGVTARALFEQAFALARQAPDPERLGRAALGFAGAGVRMWWVDVGIVNQKLIDMFEDALGALSTDDGALRARLTGALAQELYFVSGSRARRDQLSSDAVAMARRVGHQPTLAHVLANRNLAVFGPDNVEEGLEIGTEVVALGTALANREMVAYGHGHRFMAHMQLGDVASAYREFELGSQLLEELRQPAYQQIRVIAQAVKAQTSGRLDEADALAREAFALGQETRDANAALILANQMYAILRDRGELVLSNPPRPARHAGAGEQGARLRRGGAASARDPRCRRVRGGATGLPVAGNDVPGRRGLRRRRSHRRRR